MFFPPLPGIYQSTLVEGRLQAGFYEGYMMGGFVAAWIARNDFIALIATSFLLGGLFSAADALQLDANLPASTGIVIEALIIVVVLLLERRSAPPREAIHMILIPSPRSSSSRRRRFSPRSARRSANGRV